MTTAVADVPDLAALLREYRVARGLTQEAVAERAGLSVRGLSDLERGVRCRPRKDTVRLLAAALQLPDSERRAVERAARRRAGRSHAAMLPLPATSLVGRAADVASAVQRLRATDVRLLTLTGPAGIGKTRVALQVATQMQEFHVDGAVFVALASLCDADLVAPAIAQALGVKETAGMPVRESLIAALHQKELLLVLDNFEQVLAAAPLVADVLASCPRLKVLVTSRAALHVRGEQMIAVPPLALPAAAEAIESATAAQCPAVTLFLQRAQAVQADFEITDANAATVLEICRRLDGLPLALELAAARIRLLPPRALLARLERRLQVLAGGACDLPARQQTLRAAIGWSFALLDAGEQALFRRLCVFVGGCTVAAAEAVCAGADLRALDVLDGLCALVDNSLLQQQEQVDGEPRVTMLETIREYGLEQLAVSGEDAALRQRHAMYYLTLAEEADAAVARLEQAASLARLAAEHDNLRAALRWARESGEVELRVRLAGALWRFWYVRGHIAEGRGWVEEVLAAAVDGGIAGGHAHTTLLCAGAVFAYSQADDERAATLAEESAAETRARGDRQGLALSLNVLGGVARHHGHYERAMGLCEDSLTVAQEVGEGWLLALSLNNLAEAAQCGGDLERAVQLCEDSVAVARRMGDKWNLSYALNNLGHVARDQGNYGRAMALHEESLTLAQELEDKQGIASSLSDLAVVARKQGDYGLAVMRYEESLSLFRCLGHKAGIATCLEGVAALAGLHAG